MKKILPILLFIFFFTISSQGQVSRSAPIDPAGKILKTYPNPATTYITFDLQKNYQKGLTIHVYSFLGRKMYESQNVAEKTTVDLNDYIRGVYIYQLKDQTGRIIESGKFQVSK